MYAIHVFKQGTYGYSHKPLKEVTLKLMAITWMTSGSAF